MSNWNILNAARLRDGELGTNPSDGFNGAFQLVINNVWVGIIASDGAGWDHVSVSLIRSVGTPSWSIMQKVKELFWDDEVAVMQLHPPKSTWVNNHPGCLHLWRPQQEKIPLPPPIMVGLQSLNVL